MVEKPAIIGGAPVVSENIPIVRPSFADYTNDELMDTIRSILRSNMVTNGPTVEQLEESLASFLEVDHVIAVSSCTLGLALAIQAAGLTGGRALLPSFTIAATANAAWWNRCNVGFVDIDLGTFNMSVDHLKQAMSADDVDFIMPVHIFGNPSAVREIESLAVDYGAKVVYDAAHALGASFDGQKVGRFGLFEVFSGGPTKTLSSLEGGFVATNEPQIAETIRLTRNYGITPDYDCVVPGLNARMTEVNAAVALALLKDIDSFVKRRVSYAKLYQSILGDIPGLTFQNTTKGGESALNYFGVVVNPDEFGLSNRELEMALRAENIHTKVYFHPPIHRHTAYIQESGRSLPATEYLAERIICLPLYNSMDDALIEAVCAAVARIYEHRQEVKLSVT